MNLGELYFKKKKYDDAMKYLKKALIDMPTLSRAHKLIGEIHYLQGRKEEARKEFSIYKKMIEKSKQFYN